MPPNRLQTPSARPHTRGTAGRPRTAGSTVGGTTQQVICALAESRGVVAQVGLAFVNMSTAECILSEICDSQTYVRTLHKLAVFDPIEILIPESIISSRSSKLASIVEENLPGARIIPLPRKYYNESQGMDNLRRLSMKSELDAVQVAVSGKYYAISAAAAVIKHIEFQHNIRFVGHSLRVKYQSSEGSMVIDFSTVQNLELIQNLRNPKSGDCLFGLLNHTVTAMGARLLRSSIVQPLTDTTILEDRLDAVEELSQTDQMLFTTRKALQAFSDLDRLLTSLITVPANTSIKFSEKSINDVILLKKEIASIGPINEALIGCQSKLLIAVRGLCNFSKVQVVQDLIDGAISPDAMWASTPVDLRHQRCYAVKSGVNGLLDVARQTYKEATEDIHVLFQDLARDHNLPSLEIKYDTSRGYYLRIPTIEIEEASTPFPPIFINIVKKKKFTECTTLDMIKRNSRIGDAMTEVLLMSDRTIQELIDDIRSEMSALYQISDGVAMLDMMCSFAHLTTEFEYVRPEFKDALAIKDGRHPIREKIHKEKLIPNDVYASQQTRFQIVTGCNMSGKSTYIRQIALLAIMAQIGSFVPASYAAFPITTHLFARVSMDDGIEANVSTFAAEMRETAFILQNAGEGSMIIMDELGRGTCTRDGLAIAIAICEALIQKRALVWFATHFKELAAVLSKRAGVVALHMQVEMQEDQNTTSMLYKIGDGAATEKHYGINLARIIGLPSSIITRATEVSQTIASNMEQRRTTSKSYALAERRKVVLQLQEHLQQARNSNMSDQALKRWLIRLQDDFVQDMAGLQKIIEEADDDGSDESDEEDTTVITSRPTTTDDTGTTSAMESATFSGTETTSDNQRSRRMFNIDTTSSTLGLYSNRFNNPTTLSTSATGVSNFRLNPTTSIDDRSSHSDDTVRMQQMSTSNSYSSSREIDEDLEMDDYDDEI